MVLKKEKRVGGGVGKLSCVIFTCRYLRGTHLWPDRKTLGTHQKLVFWQRNGFTTDTLLGGLEGTASFPERGGLNAILKWWLNHDGINLSIRMNAK